EERRTVGREGGGSWLVDVFEAQERQLGEASGAPLEQRRGRGDRVVPQNRRLADAGGHGGRLRGLVGGALLARLGARGQGARGRGDAAPAPRQREEHGGGTQRRPTRDESASAQSPEPIQPRPQHPAERSCPDRETIEASG